MADIYEGFVERIIFRSTDTGFTVFTLNNDEDDDMCCVGSLTHIEEGTYLRVEGEVVFNQKYGEQLKVARYEVTEPKDEMAMERYLGSGAIKGVGPSLAKRIVKKFKKDTFRIIEEEPTRLSEVKGISERIARTIAEQFDEKREMRSAMVFLQQFGITNQLAVKIFNFYGDRLYTVIRENPYRLADEIEGVGFKIADAIAMKAGFNEDSEYRVKSALLYILSQAIGNGHVYLPKPELVRLASDMLPVGEEEIERQITELALEKSIVIKEDAIYSATYYYMELNVARMLCDLNQEYNIPEAVIDRRLKKIEAESNLQLDDLQKKAVKEAVCSGVFLLTGGPGTGKTTTINTIIRFFEEEGMDILLAAPTGRAAKRITETTGVEARTIHRMLEFTKGSDDKSSTGALAFARNESNPLEADAIIIDETSMVDIALMNSLLKAVMVGTRLILVGDENQLPSVGAGNVLHDLLFSGIFKTVTLNKIFRQAQESDIVTNAHKINHGEPISLNNNSRDFFFLERNDTNVIVKSVIYLVKEKIARYVGESPYEIQVLTPMKAGELGAENLNTELQKELNPASPDKAEKETLSGRLFREGDKVMQIKNNYQIEWEVKSSHGITVESGMGVFNGDCGIIKEINHYTEKLTVEYDEGKRVEYPFAQLDELVLAYAITIHKSQGSEYPAVVMPLLSGPRILFNRNVLYTAVTRAKKCVTIVGSSNTVNSMINNINEQKRYSGLAKRLNEMVEK